MRSAGFWAGTGQAVATERLYAHDGADDVAVDIDVAGTNARAYGLDGFVDPRLYAVRQPVAGIVDRIEQLRELALPKAHDMEDRPEHFACECAQIGNGNQRRRKVRAVAASLGQWQLEDLGAGRTHP